MFRMPVSQIDVELRPATGAVDLLLLENGRDVASTSIALLKELARDSDGGTVNAEQLTLTDIEALLLRVRQSLFGDVIASRGQCPDRACAAAVDISFRISEYLEHHGTKLPAYVESLTQEPDWFQLRESGVQFRLVTAEDIAVAKRSPDPEGELAMRTIRAQSPQELKRAQKKAQQAMQAMAPALSDQIEGKCPECGAAVRFWFDVQSFVQREMRYDAELLYEDVHQLASRYHWLEEAILALPRERRLQYVEIAMRMTGAN